KILAINRAKRKFCDQAVRRFILVVSGSTHLIYPPMRHYILLLTDNQLSVVQQR
ncbi:hypothetical protein CPB86DRAFT_784216, partial [Serendipita vermifera]